MWRDILYIALTVLAAIAGVGISIVEEPLFSVAGRLLYAVAIILLILQVLSLTSQHERPSQKPAASDIGKAAEPIRPPDPPRRM